jgi:hypothetical protein
MRPSVLALLLLLPLAWAQPATEAAKQLGAKIVTQVPAHSTLMVSFENRASLEGGEVDAIRAAVEQQLHAAGLELGDSEMKLRVTISEDPLRYLLVSQIGGQVAIVSWRKPPTAAAEYRTIIKRTPVWEQREPVLDISLSNDGAGMVVLEAERSVEYKKDNGRWQFLRATPITGAVVSRDPRGRLAEAGSPYHLVSGRNYFNGGARGEFYCDAEIPAGTLMTGVDGHARLYGQRAEPLLVINNWGSDIAAVTSECGSKRQVLVTAPTLDDSQDHLQAFEFTGATYAAVSEPLLLPGPVTALWAAESPGQVTLVVHNKQTGMYEASRVSLSCAQ